MPSRDAPTQILLHSDVSDWLASRRSTEPAAKAITDCIVDWISFSAIDKDCAWARLVYSAHSAPHGEGKSFSIRLPPSLKRACIAASALVAGKGWQRILNAMVRLQGIWKERPRAKVLEFHPDGLDRIRCVAGNREFLRSSNAVDEFGTLESWTRAGAEIDAHGRVVINGAEFVEDGIYVISGRTKNRLVPTPWWTEICGLLLTLVPPGATKDVAVDLWWRIFCSPQWVDIEALACTAWARGQIISGQLRIEDAPAILDGFRPYVIWRALMLNDGHRKDAGKKLKPHNKRRRALAQLTQNIGTLDPGKNVLCDVARALQIHDGTIPSEQEVENAAKRIYEDGYARLPLKRG